MPESTSQTDLSLARTVVERGWTTPERVQECLRILSDLADRGVQPPRLAELLVQMGYVDPDQLEELRSERPTVALPIEANRAERDVDNVVGKYVRVQKLGSGGMGEVWKAWDKGLGRWVALKFLKSDAPEELARFAREAQTAAKLSHPNIASIFEVGEHRGRPFIAMQYVEGRTLSKIPRKDTRALIGLVRDAALAVHYAHQQGVVHRDLKPDNLMVEDATGRVYVMDFGIARQIEGASRISVSGTVLGTPSYMSPEQAMALSSQIDARSDVYSLGATLYELLTGRSPFEGENQYVIIRKVVEEEPAPLGHEDRDLETIVMKCLEKERSRRYPTARGLADDLGRWLGGEAIRAHPPSTFYRLSKYLARRKAILIAAAVAGVVVLGVGVWWWSLRRQARAWEREARARAHEGKYDEALMLLERARARIGIDETLYRLCAAKVKEERDRTEAIRREQEVFGPIKERLKTLPPNREGRERALQLLEEGLAKFEASPDAWIRKAEALWGLARFQEAFDAYGRAAELQPGLGSARYWRGVILMDHLNRLDDARLEFEAAERAEPGYEAAKIGRARIAVLTGNPKLALEICDEAEPSAGHMADLYFIRAFVRSRRLSPLFDANRAVEDYTRAIKLRPEQVLYWANRGAVFIESGRPAEAVRDLERALEAAPDFADAWYNLGAARQLQGEHEEAIRAYTRALELRRDSSDTWAARSRSRLALGDPEGAIQDCTKAISIRPDNAEAWFFRGDARRALRDYAEAVKDYDRAIRLRPQFPEAFNNRGNAKQGLNDLEGAIQDHTRAIEQNPRMPEAYAGRAEAKEKLAAEDASRARDLLQSAVRDMDKALEVAPASWPFRGIAEEMRDRILEKLRRSRG